MAFAKVANVIHELEGFEMAYSFSREQIVRFEKLVREHGRLTAWKLLQEAGEKLSLSTLAKFTKKVKLTAGRPPKFTTEQLVLYKTAVRQHGLLAAFNKLREEGHDIGLNSLAKYAKSGKGGPPVRLKRGRPAKAA